MAWFKAEGALWEAVHETASQITPLETEWDQPKLEKKLNEYFTKASKSVEFNTKSFQECVDDYCDNAYSSIYCGLWDREWLGQVNFLMCVDGGVKDCFPPWLRKPVPPQEFEQIVLASSERASDQQRFFGFRWETIQRLVEGKTTQKKVREALDSGRADAVMPFLFEDDKDTNSRIEEFITAWITSSIQHLGALVGDVNNLFSVDTAIQLFDALVQEGAIPVQLTQESGIPAATMMIDKAAREAYVLHGDGPPKGSKGSAKGSAPKPLITLWDAASMASKGDEWGGKGSGGWGKGKGGDDWGGKGYDSWGGGWGEEPAAKWFKGDGGKGWW